MDSATKIGADKIVESFNLSFGLPVVTVRPFNTYGPRQSARAVIPTIVTQALTDETIRLGNIEPTRDLNYVADTVEGFIKAAESPKAVGEVINLGTGREISIGELAATILKSLGKDLPIVTENERVRPEGSEVDWEKLFPSGFRPLPRRWVVERSFAWITRWRRLARDHEGRAFRAVRRSSSSLPVAACSRSWLRPFPN